MLGNSEDGDNTDDSGKKIAGKTAMDRITIESMQGRLSDWLGAEKINILIKWGKEK